MQPSRLHFLLIPTLFLLKRSSSDFELRGSVPAWWPLFLWDEDTMATEKSFEFSRFANYLTVRIDWFYSNSGMYYKVRSRSTSRLLKSKISKMMQMILEMCLQFRGFTKFGTKVLWRLQFFIGSWTLNLKFQKARTKIGNFLPLPS